MARKKNEERTRQVYATIREDLYLDAKARATEMRMPLREFIEHALELALNRNTAAPAARELSVWEDEYLRIQTRQPLGSPVELSRDEAAKVVRATFGLDASNDDD